MEFGVITASRKRTNNSLDYVFECQVRHRVHFIKSDFVIPDEVNCEIIRYHSKCVTCLEFHPTNNNILLSGFIDEFILKIHGFCLAFLMLELLVNGFVRSSLISHVGVLQVLLHGLDTTGRLSQGLDQAQGIGSVPIPLANLLGMYQIKYELENLSFMYINPQEYAKVKRRVAELCKEQKKEIEEKIEDDQFLDLMTMKTKVRSVYKEPYRIIIKPKPCVGICYHVLGLVHGIWTPIPRAMKDYIGFHLHLVDQLFFQFNGMDSMDIPENPNSLFFSICMSDEYDLLTFDKLGQHVRRAAVLALSIACHNKPNLIKGLLPELLPLLYDQTVIKKELIRMVDVGPFKHTVDDGLDLRKATFESVDTLLDNCPD
ncbi:hypothetical protein Lser_V15G29037 [Lactuca serriola]